MITKQTYSEVYAIISMMSKRLKEKIPQGVLDGIENNRDKEICIEIRDVNKFEISKQGEEFLAVLYKNYFATDEEKKIIKAKELSLFEKEQKELREKYNLDNLFRNVRKK